MLSDNPTLKKTNIKVKEFLEDKNSVVFFFDEGRFGLRSTVKRTWAKKGEPLRVMVKQGFKNFYGYSSVSPIDGENFTLLLPGVNSELMNLYLKELSQAYKGRKILLIMDQAGWHRSRELEINSQITFLFLPPYSPELNPVEKLWEWIKKETVHNMIYESLDRLMDNVCKELRNLSKDDMKRLCNCSYI